MRFVCDACQDITNIEADRMEIQGEKSLRNLLAIRSARSTHFA